MTLDAAMTLARRWLWTRRWLGARCTTRVFTDFSFSTAPRACILRAFSPISLFLLPLHTLDYARFPLFFFFYCPCTRWTTRVFTDFSFSTAPAPISYARFRRFLFFYCPCTRCTTRVFRFFSFSTATAPVSYARFPLFLFFYCPCTGWTTRVFRKFSFHTARNLSIITLHSLISLSRLHAAFAGLVLGSLTASIPVCFSQYL